MKIAFFGAGNMGGAMVRAAVESGAVQAADILVYDKNETAAGSLSKSHGTETVGNAVLAAQRADILFIAVKPAVVPELLEEIRSAAEKEKIIVSIAAGVKVSAYTQIVGQHVKIVRAIPNMPAMVREGITGIYFENFTETDEAVKDRILTIFNAFGKTVTVYKESLIDEMVAVTSSSPAYVCLMIEAMADAAVKFGFARGDAYMMAEQAVLGTAKLLRERDVHPAALKDQICSPAGTTIEAVASLEASGFRSSLIGAMEACRRKTFQLGGKENK